MICQCCKKTMRLAGPKRFWTDVRKGYQKTFVCSDGDGSSPPAEEGCGHFYWNWQKTKEEVEEYYKNVFRELNKDKKVPAEIRKKWAAHIIKFVKETDLLSKYNLTNYLEIGAYDGIFSQCFKEHFENIKVSVCELDIGSCEKYLNGKFEHVHNCNFLDIKDKKYDILAAIDVLEHFDDLSQFKNQAINLNCNTLIIQVPYNRPVKLKIDKLDFHPHCHLFNKDSITKFFKPEYSLEAWKSTEYNESAKGPEQICIFKKSNKDEK